MKAIEIEEIRSRLHEWWKADEQTIDALCDLALQSLSMRSGALREPSPEQWQEFYDRIWDSDETNPTLALPTQELQRIGRALIAALQDVHSTELRK